LRRMASTPLRILATRCPKNASSDPEESRADDERADRCGSLGGVCDWRVAMKLVV
jgi:hypothetical protein